MWSPMRFRHAAWVLLAATPALADPPTTAPVDKSAYTLFNPAPADVKLRDLNSDRPSITTGPFTVDPGHVQVEASFLQFTQDQSIATGGDGGQLFAVAPTEFRVGLTDRAEVDLTVTPFLYQRTAAVTTVRPAPSGGRQTTPAGHAYGFGDLQLQSKLNLLGDNGGDVAFGVVPYLTLPTASATRGLGTGRLQGGLILPLQLNLPADFTLGTEAEFDFPRNGANTGTGFDCLHTVVLSHALFGPIDMYGEYAGVAPVALGHGYQAYADAGLLCAVSADVQFDVAVDLGCSRDTAAYTILAGITVRR